MRRPDKGAQAFRVGGRWHLRHIGFDHLRREGRGQIDRGGFRLRKAGSFALGFGRTLGLDHRLGRRRRLGFGLGFGFGFGLGFGPGSRLRRGRLICDALIV
ncbi:MAG: hypothetical protein FJ038_04070 [Chloroflexi bacterium]|nr:hypothetical protein [Chloroflexota bacterium]